MIRMAMFVVVIAVTACFQPGNAPQCTVICASNADCPGELACNAGNRCSVGGAMCGRDAGVDSSVIDSAVDASVVDGPPDAFSCISMTPQGCVDGDTENRCNPSGDGITQVECGALGCNATTGGCNVCLIGETTCQSQTELRRCVDGQQIVVDDTCQHGCVAEAGTVAAHCAHIEPRFLPNVCDTRTTNPAVVYAGNVTINTTLDTSCTGGIINQAGAPQICVIRARSFDFGTAATVKVTGVRVVAFVADDGLVMSGLLDVSADFLTNGPGGGRLSGAEATTAVGGGGAGYRSFGAAGGSLGGAGTGGAGGPILDADASLVIVGGGKAESGTVAFPDGGGGGGAALLVSCSRTLYVHGTINAGGGGGGGGVDIDPTAGVVTASSGGGGGSGGYVVFQGPYVELSLTSRMYSNGGCGGSGTSVDNDSGNQGPDATTSLTPCPAAAGTGTGGNGGIGALGTLFPVAGAGGGGGGSHGGGGGSTGRFKIYTRTGIGAMNDAAVVSPIFDTDGTVPLE